MASKKNIRKMSKDLDVVVGTGLKKHYAYNQSDMYSDWADEEKERSDLRRELGFRGGPKSREEEFRRDAGWMAESEAEQPDLMGFAREVADYISIRYTNWTGEIDSYSLLNEVTVYMFPSVMDMSYDEVNENAKKSIAIEITMERGSPKYDVTGEDTNGRVAFHEVSYSKEQAYDSIDNCMRKICNDYFASSKKSLRKSDSRYELKSKLEEMSQQVQAVAMRIVPQMTMESMVADAGFRTGSIGTYTKFEKHLDDAIQAIDDFILSLFPWRGFSEYDTTKGVRKSGLPEDADETEDDVDTDHNGKQSLPEDADETEDDVEGSYSRQTGLPEDAEAGLNQSEGKKGTLADEKATEDADDSQDEVHKYSVACHGSQRYDGRQNYNQSPMMRECIDRGMSTNEVVKMLNERLGEVGAHKLYPQMSKSVPLKIKKQ